MDVVQPMDGIWTILAVLLVALGLAGSVIPVLPGPFLIWLGALVYAWASDFTVIGWGMLTVLLVLAVAAWWSDLFLSTVMSRRAGASWKAILGAIVGGLVGAMLLSGVPIFGTILGALLGAMAGMWIVEYFDKGNHEAATTAVQAYVGSVLVAALVEMVIALLMVGIIVARVFF